MYDEPLALTSADQAHFDGCPACKARFESIANAARATATLLNVPAFTPEPVAALRSMRVRMRGEEAANPPRWYERWIERVTPRWRPIATPAVAVLLAGALLTGVTATGAAEGWFRVFEPRTVAPVQVSASDFATTGKVYTASVVAKTPMRLVTLSHWDLTRLRKRYPELADELRSVIEQRKEAEA